MSPDEPELIARCLAGEAEAQQALHAAHAGSVLAYFRRSGFSWAEAEDLAQDVFVRAFRSLEGFDASRGNFRGWLGAIARNVARRQWARRNRGENFDPELAEQTFAAPANPHDTPEAREEIEAVRSCVDALPPELARVIRLRYVEARTTRGIAAATGMPEATVRLRLTEARGVLDRAMREKGFIR